MKAIKTLTAALLILTAASSCKKETTPAPVDNSPKVSKIEKADGSYSMRFTYNAQGRLAQAKDNYFTINFEYPSGSFSYTLLNDLGIKKFDLGSPTVVNGRVTQFNYRGFNTAGDVSSNTPTTVQYDANGFQSQKSYESATLTTEVTGGNMTKLIKYINGSQDEQTAYEFYADKPSKFNVNVFENYYYDHILCDKGMFGKQNANLLKKVTHQSGSTTRIYEYNYVTDANGLVTSFTLNGSTNGVPSSPVTYNVSWQ